MSSTLCGKVKRYLRLLLPAISAQQRIPADCKYIQKHLDAVPHHVDLRSRIMRPSYGNLHCFQAVMARQIKQFGVKAETFDSLLVENDLATRATKCLKTTLGVDEREPQYDAHNSIEHDPGKLAKR